MLVSTLSPCVLKGGAHVPEAVTAAPWAMQSRGELLHPSVYPTVR